MTREATVTPAQSPARLYAAGVLTGLLVLALSNAIAFRLGQFVERTQRLAVESDAVLRELNGVNDTLRPVTDSLRCYLVVC